MYFELVDEEKDNISEEENSKHVIHWVDRKKVPSFVTASYDQVTARKIADKSFETISCFDKEGILINSAEFNGLTSEEVKSKITEFVGGKMVTKYKMRDAIFARQRYWGEPIPLSHEGDLIKPLSEKDLPLELPKVDSYKPSGTGESPLAGVPEWKDAGYETNTMPGWAGSSWYFLRYMDPKNSEAFVGKDALDYWQNVDVYIGGAEHATGHLLYARFWNKFLNDLGYVPTDEPFKLLKNQGLILASDGRKMSKRWGNVVNPDEMVDRFGADSFRLYEMFIGPFDQYTSWNTDGLVGTRRFLERVWRAKEYVVSYKIDNPPPLINGTEVIGGYEHLRISLNKTIKKIKEDITNFRFNTSVSSMMILVNEIEAERRIEKEDFKKFLQILAPFAPHMTEELWHELGESGSIHTSSWPKADESKLKDEKIKIAVQINGKVRDEIEIAQDASEEEVKNIATKRDAVKEHISGKEIKKFIYIPGKIVNIVI
ncbi:MAG: class I tRNA ligase family protein [Candidatus Paceibacterota bacterium]